MKGCILLKNIVQFSVLILITKKGLSCSKIGAMTHSGAYDGGNMSFNHIFNKSEYFEMKFQDFLVNVLENNSQCKKLFPSNILGPTSGGPKTPKIPNFESC